MIKVIKKKIVHTTVQFIHDLKRSWYSCIIKIKTCYLIFASKYDNKTLKISKK